ncbi:phospho-N-acetylmuramoyl-pentapeptide-transferase [Guggenheimella bovis]
MTNIIYVVVSFIVTFVALIFLIPFLTRLKFGQPILEDAPKTHQKKQGIPTMGGISFLFATVVVSLVALGAHENHVFMVLGMVLFAIVGFLDDGIKISKKHNEGLTPTQKLILQIIFAFFMAYILRDNARTIRIPFSKTLFDLGILYYPFVIVFYLAMTNGANLTDGVDGLLTAVTMTIVIFTLLIARSLHKPFIFSGNVIFLGSLLAFFVANKHPAKIFMGDTGSLAIGGFIATVLLLVKMPIYAILVSIIYVLESLSVIIQVAVFKRTGKRFFKKAPLHHHFEESGYSENMIVAFFSAINLVGVILALLIFNL